MKWHQYAFSFFWLCAALLTCRSGNMGPDEVRGGGKPPGGKPPAAPQNLMARASTGQVTLTWNTQTGVTYNLYHSRTASVGLENSTKVSDVPSPYTHTGLTDFTTYYYRLTAVNSFGVSPPTKEVSARTLPASPQNFTALAFSGQVTLSWIMKDSVTYHLYHSRTAGAGLENSTKVPDVPSPYTHTGLTDSTTYYYRLTANIDRVASAPTKEVSATPQAQISAGKEYTCAVVEGRAVCWGDNEFGQLGNNKSGEDVFSNTPQQVMGLTTGVTQIATGNYHACAVVEGRAVCWGQGWYGKLVNATYSMATTPEQVYGLTTGVTQITAGGDHTCAVVNGGAKCWGSGDRSRLGTGNNSTVNTPVQVKGLTTGVTQIAAGEEHTCAVVEDRAVCWGVGASGQLGNDSVSDAQTPVQVKGLTTGVTQIAAGGGYTCAVVEGAAECWGWGSSGQLGNGTNSFAKAPQTVKGITSGVTQITAGKQHTCAVVEGRAKCWGEGSNGRLGNGRDSDAVTSVPVRGLISGVGPISAGGKHTCAVVSGGVKCWGAGGNGQLGNNAAENKKIPVPVSGL